MKKTALTLLMGVIGMHVSAQDRTYSPEHETETTTKKKKVIVRPEHSPNIYITTSTGVNNNTGIMGFTFDVPVSKNVSIEAGPGQGQWGSKVFAGAKYYLSPNHRGFALGAGIAYCPGVYHDRADLQTVYGNTESIEYNKNHVTSMLFTVHKYWNLGKKHNRFYLETGWSTPISHDERITQLSGHRMSNDERDHLRFAIQEGPILAVGFSFGVH